MFIILSPLVRDHSGGRGQWRGRGDRDLFVQSSFVLNVLIPRGLKTKRKRTKNNEKRR